MDILEKERQREHNYLCAALNGIKSLQNISLQILEVFNSNAEAHQIVFYSILEPLRLVKIPIPFPSPKTSLLPPLTYKTMDSNK